MTPVPRAIARPLVASLKHEVFCREHDIAQYIPDPDDGLVGFDRAVELALRRIKEADVATRWSNASVLGAPSDPLPTDPDWAGGSLYSDERERETTASPAALWQVIEGIGGERGWYSFPLAWEVRGLMDRAVGGVGLRRGRRDPDRLMVGESLDFWRVEERIPEQLLRLRAEMRLPGLAWLEMTRRRGPDHLPAARHLPPARPLGPRLLVDGRALPRHRLRLDGPQHRAGRRGRRRGSARASATSLRAPRRPRSR